jgi:hypothetical protein
MPDDRRRSEAHALDRLRGDARHGSIEDAVPRRERVDLTLRVLPGENLRLDRDGDLVALSHVPHVGGDRRRHLSIRNPGFPKQASGTPSTAPTNHRTAAQSIASTRFTKLCVYSTDRGATSIPTADATPAA